MKTKSKLVLILFAIIVLISTAVFATEATPTTEGTAPTAEGTTTPEEGTSEISADDIINTDKFYAGDNVEMADLVNGNVYIIGKEVKITGKVDTDLFVIAEKLVIENTAEIYGNVFAIAGEINISGKMYDTYLVCDKLNFDFYAQVGRDLRVMASEVNLNGLVYKDSYIEADKVTIKDFETAGNLNYIAQSNAIFIEKLEDDTTRETTEIPEKIIRGEVNYTQRKKKLFKKDIKKVVQEILETNKISNDTSEQQIKSIILSYVFNGFGINTNSEAAKGSTSTITIPKVHFYIVLVLLAILVIALVLPIIKKNANKVKTPKENKENKNE